MKNSGSPLIALVLSAALVSCDRPANQAAPLPDVPDGFMAKDAAWEVAVADQLYSDSPAVDAKGIIFFADGAVSSPGVFTGRIMKLDADQAQLPEVFAAGLPVTQGLVFGPDGYLYACRPQEFQIVRYSPDGAHEILVQGEMATGTDASVAPKRGGAGLQFCNDLAVSPNGGIWFTDRNSERILYLSPEGDLQTVASGFRGNGMLLSLDKKMLVVTDSRQPKLHAFRVSENGSLDELPDFFAPLKLSEQKPQVPMAAGGSEWSAGGAEGATGANGMALDSEGRIYVPTFLGVQILDKDGQHLGTIPGADGYMSNLGFGGADRKWLYSTGTQMSRLRMEVRGALP